MKRYAILIGSSRFDKEPKLKPLRCPENDVDGMREIVEAQEFGAFTETFVLKNADHHKVIDQIEETLSEATNEDQILIYYSGHGKTDMPGRLYLTTVNTEERKLFSSSVPVESLRILIENSKCKKIALILDCCFAGAAGKTFATVKGDVDEGLKALARGNGIYLLTASTAYQTAVEKEADEYSLLTKHIINGIKSGAAARANSAHISIEDLYLYVHRQVIAEGHQEPMCWALNVRGEELIVARTSTLYSPERLRAFKKKINDLDANDYILEKIANDARRIIAANQQKQDQVFFDLLNHLCEGTLRTGSFSHKWLELMDAPQVVQPVTQVPEPVLEETYQPLEQQEEPQPPQEVVPVMPAPMPEAVLLQHEQQETDPPTAISRSLVSGLVQLVALITLMVVAFMVARNWERFYGWVVGKPPANLAAGATTSPPLLDAELVAAQALFEERRYDKARESFTALVAKDKNNAEYRYWLGRAFYELKQPAEAVKQFTAAAKLNDKLPNVFVHLALAQEATGDKKGAVESLRRAMVVPNEEQSSTQMDAELAAARALFEERRYDKARESFTALVAKDKNNAEYRYWLGRAFYELEQPAEAVKQLTEATKLNAKLPNVFVYLALAQEATGDKKGAVESLKRAVVVPQ